jgi:hypothetical protein
MNTRIPTHLVIEIPALSDENESDRQAGHLRRPDQMISITGAGEGRVRLHVFPQNASNAGCAAILTVPELRDALDLIEARPDQS